MGRGGEGRGGEGRGGEREGRGEGGEGRGGRGREDASCQTILNYITTQHEMNRNEPFQYM